MVKNKYCFTYTNYNTFKSEGKKNNSKEKLLDLDRLAKRECSGIDFDLLFGVWKFASVFKKETDDEDYFFSSFLAQSIQKLPTSKKYNNFWQFLHRRSVLVLS